MSSYLKDLNQFLERWFDDDDELQLEHLIRSPERVSLDDCLAGPAVPDRILTFRYEDDDFPEQNINQSEPHHDNIPPTIDNIPFGSPMAATPTTDNIPSGTPMAATPIPDNIPFGSPIATTPTIDNTPSGAPMAATPIPDNTPSAHPMAATVDILPATHNTVVASITCNEPTITHTSAPIFSFNPPSSYTIAPTTYDNDSLLYYHPSSCTIPTTEIETFYDPSFTNPFIETYPLASHNTPTNTPLCMATHNVPTLLNSQPPPPSGLPMAPIYLTNQLNQVISTPPSYTTYSLDPIVSQRSTMNSPSSLGMDPSTFNSRPLFDTTSAFGGLHYNDNANAGFGFFTDAGMTVRRSEAMEPCNLGMYSSALMQTFYDPENLQVLRDSNQPMVGCSTGMAPLQVAAKDESKIDESNFKVRKLTLEEKQKKIIRYIEKKKARNYNKKINYPCRKILADSRHRVRGRFAKNDEVPQAASRPPTSVDHYYVDDDERMAAKQHEETLQASTTIALRSHGYD